MIGLVVGEREGCQGVCVCVCVCVQEQPTKALLSGPCLRKLLKDEHCRGAGKREGEMGASRGGGFRVSVVRDRGTSQRGRGRSDSCHAVQ